MTNTNPVWTEDYEFLSDVMMQGSNPCPTHYVAAVNAHRPITHEVPPFTAEELEAFWQHDLSPVEAMTVAYSVRYLEVRV